MVLDKKYTVRDPVHGFIHFTEQECQLIDSKPFQRLRNLKQLATAYLVYPGAVHTRFDHSLGVMHVAGRIVKHLKETQSKRLEAVGEDPEELEKRVRLAALCHDLGHGPFCHVSEPVIKHVNQGFKGNIDALHEKITCRIIEDIPEIRDILKDDYGQVLSILKGTTTDGRETKTVAKGIVSGPIDADKMDYLLRDSYFTGVKYGVFDIDKVIESLVVIQSKELKREEASYLGVRKEGLRALEQMILAKFFIGEQVYYLKTRTAGDLLINRALQNALEEEITDQVKDKFICKAFIIDDKWKVEDYLNLYDQKVIDYLVKRKTQSGELFSYLTERRLPKRRIREKLKYEELEEWDRKKVYDSLRDKVSLCSREKEIANLLGIEDYCVYIKLGFTKYPKFGTKKHEINEDDIMVEDEKGHVIKYARIKDRIIETPSVQSEISEDVLELYILFRNETDNKRFQNKKMELEKKFISIMTKTS